MAAAARWFQDTFKGDVFYAVKANPSPWVIETLAANGVASFDVASVPEIELVAQFAPGSRMAFMHPVKSRAAIAAAYFDHGVKTFALDSHEELQKIIEATGGADDLTLIVRLGVQAEGATYSLSGKFGVELHEAPSLLLAARRATQDRMGVSFHVGSQCMRPTAFQAALAQANRAIVRAGVLVDVVDVGGGFLGLSRHGAAGHGGLSRLHRPRFRRDVGARDHRAVVRTWPGACGGSLLHPDQGRARRTTRSI